QMLGPQRYLARALPLDLHDQAGIGCLQHDLVVQTQCETDAVETRAKIGAGRRHHGAGDQPGGQHLIHYARPNFSTTSTGSTGSAATLGMSFRAVSGSLRPLPVTVHTTVDPRATQPSSTDLSRPAMLAADAGSTNTPSDSATRW